MARPLIPATPREVTRVDSALYHLRMARDLLSGHKTAETPVAPQALERVNATIKSTEGALRHVERRLHASADATATREHYDTTGPSLKRVRYDTGR